MKKIGTLFIATGVGLGLISAISFYYSLVSPSFREQVVLYSLISIITGALLINLRRYGKGAFGRVGGFLMSSGLILMAVAGLFFSFSLGNLIFGEMLADYSYLLFFLGMVLKLVDIYGKG